MCCVGTKNLLADYHYIVRQFVKVGALTAETAVSFATLDLDFSERYFARDNLQSMMRGGDIVCRDGLYHLARRRKDDDKCTAAAYMKNGFLF